MVPRNPLRNGCRTGNCRAAAWLKPVERVFRRNCSAPCGAGLFADDARPLPATDLVVTGKCPCWPAPCRSTSGQFAVGRPTLVGRTMRPAGRLRPAGRRSHWEDLRPALDRRRLRRRDTGAPIAADVQFLRHGDSAVWRAYAAACSQQAAQKQYRQPDCPAGGLPASARFHFQRSSVPAGRMALRASRQGGQNAAQLRHDDGTRPRFASVKVSRSLTPVVHSSRSGSRGGPIVYWRGWNDEGAR